MKLAQKEQEILDSLDGEFKMLYNDNPQLVGQFLSMAVSVIEQYKTEGREIHPKLGQEVVSFFVQEAHL